MPVRLFHRTTLEGSQAIPADGFKNGDDGVVWFSRYLDAWGNRGHFLLEVITSIGVDELEAFAQSAVADEVWDEAVGDFVQTQDEESIERFIYYAIPADCINGRCTVRLVPASEINAINGDSRS